MTDFKLLIIENFALIISMLFGSGSFIAYYFERNKRGIEEKQLASDALKTMQDAYDKFTEDALGKYHDLSKEITELKEKLIAVTLHLNEEQKKYNMLRGSYERLKQSYDVLKRNFEEYKKSLKNPK